MGRKQVTYGHKRHKNRTQLAKESSSSPLLDITDPDDKLTRTEMTRRMLKRSRRSGSGSASGSSILDRRMDIGYSFKKPKLSLHEELQPAHELGYATFLRNPAYDLQTPYPTLLTEAQIFKLESSRGRPLPSDHEFSPVPLAPKHRFSPSSNGRLANIQAHANRKNDLSRKISSRSLKENVTAPSSRPSSHSRSQFSKANRPVTRSKSKTKASQVPLASPFSSQPSSPHMSPKPKTKKKFNISIPITRPTTAKRTLSDTHFNPNIPLHRNQGKVHAQSTTNSPVRQVADPEFNKHRRPSAPSTTAQRPDVASWFVSSTSSNTNPNLDHDNAHSPSIFDLTSLVGHRVGVDFNRPPSQLSYTSSYDENFFGDAFGISTPFGLRAQSTDRQSCPESPDSTDEEDNGWDPTRHISHLVSSHSNMLSQMTSRTHDTLPMALRQRIERSDRPWLSDSIISPPSSAPKCAYIPQSSPVSPQDIDVEMKPRSRAERHDNDGNASGLVMEPNGCSVKQSLPRSKGMREDSDHEARRETLQDLFHSLDLGFGDDAPSISRTHSLDIEPGRSQLRAPTQGNALQSPARISPSETKRLDTETATKEMRGGRDRRGTIRASDFPAQLVAGARRTRSGTVVQGPTRPRRERSDTIIARPQATLVPSSSMECEDIVMLDPQGNDGCLNVNDVHMSGEEDADELNLMGYWHDEDWVVADPPSPEVPRRKSKPLAAWKKHWGPGRGLGMWGMAEHDEDDEGDDPLLLK